MLHPTISVKGEGEMTKCCVKILAQLVNSLRVLVDDFFFVTAIKANQLNLKSAMCFFRGSF